MEKLVRITGKRQITIPKEFFDALSMNTTLRAYLEGGRLVLEPLYSEDPLDFSQEIIDELADEGLTGQELKSEFARRREGILAAMRQIVLEAVQESRSQSNQSAVAFINKLIDDSE